MPDNTGDTGYKPNADGYLPTAIDYDPTKWIVFYLVAGIIVYLLIYS